VVRAGIDFGGVISTLARGARPGAFGNDRIEVRGAFSSIKKMVRRYGAGNLFVVSRCNEGVDEAIQGWLVDNDFFGRTGFSDRNLRFCLRREDKAPIVRELGLTTAFIDDHEDVLWPMEGIVTQRIVFTHGAMGRPITTDNRGLILTSTWAQVLQVVEEARR
jgi:hypothetical protein